MEKLNDVIASPTPWDSRANLIMWEESPSDEWLVVMDRNRDSDILTESNWECALRELGGEGENVQIIRMGHWACGWIEYLSVKAGTDQERIGQEIENSLAEYPILDEEVFSERQTEEANQVWCDNYTWQERIAYIRNASLGEFSFDRWTDMLDCVRGNYFPGYASELIN